MRIKLKDLECTITMSWCLFRPSSTKTVHLVKLVTWPQAIYTVQVHGAVSVLMADSVGQTTLFMHLNYTSDEDDAHHIDAIRPAGAGCTQSAFVNYSPFATREDDSCIEGSQIQIESTPAVGGGLADWYGNGLIAILQPLLLGGHTLLNPALFSSSNGILIQRAYVLHREISYPRVRARVFPGAAWRRW